MIGSSLVVITVICMLFLAAQRSARIAQNHAEGASLVQTLADVPLMRLVPPAGQVGAFRLLNSSVSNPDFVYALVTGPDGEVLAEQNALGQPIPRSALPPDPASWLGDRPVELPSGLSVQEFHAPLLEDGVLVGHVRIGLQEPGLIDGVGNLSQLGVLALPIFLLTLLAHWWIRREMQPVQRVNEQLDIVLANQRLAEILVEAPGETGEFVDRFNRFVSFAEKRLRETEEAQTELRTSSKILSYQKERSESVLDALPDAALVLDDAGAVTFANLRLQTLLQIDPGHALGKLPAEWCPFEDLLAFLNRCTGAKAGRRSEQSEFTPAQDPDRRFGVYAHPLGGERNGAHAGTLVLIRDISAKVLAERAHSEFVSHVTHELKTPLNSIAMYAESLLEKAGDSEEFRIEACNVIQDEVHRLSDLLKALHTIARIETGTLSFDRQRIALADFIKDASENIARSGRNKEVGVELELDGELPAIHGDKDLLRIALNNLLTNAVKYSNEGGHVVVRAEETPDYVSIRVSDEGIGVSEEELTRIFEKFFRSESDEARKRSGHGLGLSLAKEIAELQGGRIEVQSVKGEGSTFSLVVPKNSHPNEEN